MKFKMTLEGDTMDDALTSAEIIDRLVGIEALPDGATVRGEFDALSGPSTGTVIPFNRCARDVTQDGE